MLAFKYLALFIAGVTAQAAFGAPENSAAVLDALKAVDDSTIASARAATAFRPNNAELEKELKYQNYVLRSNWQYVQYLAQSSQGFYSDAGAQAIIDYINVKLFPDTRDADKIYTDKRAVFLQSSFINFINPGLVQLRLAVAEAAGALIAKTRASRLTAITIALLSIELNYSETQEYQQFGLFPTDTCTIPAGLCGVQGSGYGDVLDGSKIGKRFQV
ncbi:hypothetical protein AMS68_006432 [Peltaster fructicola]|uniref:Uncharacterized protein n=1 Tax=Peltaster fructicola TaxID=286661 RepID=A0A6H0Y1X4_9PEZI|nr:hypothetical protein AMS68_006432 [Peltaster fructicola]